MSLNWLWDWLVKRNPPTMNQVEVREAEEAAIEVHRQRRQASHLEARVDRVDRLMDRMSGTDEFTKAVERAMRGRA